MVAQRCWRWLLCAFTAVGAASCGSSEIPSDEPLPKKVASPPPFIISNKTTYLTEPLLSDGYVDYVQALNDRYSKEVTPETNAAILYFHHAGFENLGEPYRARCFELLGVQGKIPDPAVRFIPFAEFPAADLDEDTRRRLRDEQFKARSRPWKSSEFPDIAAWIARNQKPLDSVIDGTLRSRCFIPLVPYGSEVNMVSAMVPLVQQLADFGNALACRAMLRLKEGNVTAASQDVLACYRLSVHAGHGPTMVQRLVGLGLHWNASLAAMQIANSEKLNRGQAVEIQKFITSLPDAPAIAEAIDQGERFMLLDSIALITRDVESALSMVFEQPSESWKELFRHQEINWEKVLSEGNQWYDRVVDAARQPSQKQRNAAFKAIEAELKNREAHVTPESLLIGKASLPEREWVTEAVHNLLILQFRTAFHASRNNEERNRMARELAILALGLSIYRHDHSQYPDSLSALAPKCVVAIPVDRFSSESLIYKSTGTEYLLYSVGENGEDNGGRSFTDQPSGDDLTVRSTSAVHN